MKPEFFAPAFFTERNSILSFCYVIKEERSTIHTRLVTH